jgi:hypothetical protein
VPESCWLWLIERLPKISHSATIHGENGCDQTDTGKWTRSFRQLLVAENVKVEKIEQVVPYATTPQPDNIVVPDTRKQEAPSEAQKENISSSQSTNKIGESVPTIALDQDSHEVQGSIPIGSPKLKIRKAIKLEIPPNYSAHPWDSSAGGNHQRIPLSYGEPATQIRARSPDPIHHTNRCHECQKCRQPG